MDKQKSAEIPLPFLGFDELVNEARRMAPPRILPEYVPPKNELEAAQGEVTYLRHLLLDMVKQNCRPHPSRTTSYDIDAGFISTHAEAIRYLCDHGLLEMVNDGYGRCVQARTKPLRYRAAEFNASYRAVRGSQRPDLPAGLSEHPHLSGYESDPDL